MSTYSDFGGEIRVYNSGIRTPDYERLNISWDSNICYIEPTSAGTGTNRSLYLRSDGDSGLTIKANAVDIHANNWNTPRIIFGASNTTTYNTIRPVNNGIQGLGATTNRWSEIFTETLTLGESVDTVVANSSGITIDGQDPSETPLVVRGAVVQNTNLAEWQDSASTVLNSIGTDGTFSLSSGEIHVYNSGYAIGATDYERIDIKYDGSNNEVARIVSAAGGSSTAKGMHIGTEANSLDLLTGGGSQFRWRFNDVVEYVITSASIRGNNTQKDLGTSSNTWGTTYSDNFIGDTTTIGSGDTLNPVLTSSGHSTLDLRDGTNPQQFHIYNTFDGANYERLEVKWDTDVATIATAAAGTGSNVNLVIGGPNYATVSNLFFNASNNNGALRYGTTEIVSFGSTFVQVGRDFYPSSDSLRTNGTDIRRWLNTYTDTITIGNGVDTVVANSSGITIDGQDPSVSPFVVQGAVSQNTNLTEWQDSASTVLNSIGTDGTFSVGSGEIHVYNSGYAIGAADHERLEIKWDSNELKIDSTADGTGTARAFDILYNGSRRFRGNSAFSFMYQADGTYVAFGANEFKPQLDSTVKLGSTSARWSNTYTDILTVGDGVDTVVANSSGITIDGQDPSASPFVVQGAPSQNANLTEWKNSADEVLASIDSAGSFYASGDISISGVNNGGKIIFIDDNVSTDPYLHWIDSATAFRLYGNVLVRGGAHGVDIRGNSTTGGVIASQSHAIGFSSTVVSNGTNPDTCFSRAGANHMRLQSTYNNSSYVLGQLTASGVNLSGVYLAEYEPPTAALKEQTLYSSGNQLAFNASGIPYSEPSGTLVGVASGVFNFLVINSGDYVDLGSYEPETIYFVV